MACFISYWLFSRKNRKLTQQQKKIPLFLCSFWTMSSTTLKDWDYLRMNTAVRFIWFGRKSSSSSSSIGDFQDCHMRRSLSPWLPAINTVRMLRRCGFVCVFECCCYCCCECVGMFLISYLFVFAFFFLFFFCFCFSCSLCFCVRLCSCEFFQFLRQPKGISVNTEAVFVP